MFELDLLWSIALWVLIGCCIALAIGSATDLGDESGSGEQ